jgi:hypothetical protein
MMTMNGVEFTTTISMAARNEHARHALREESEHERCVHALREASELKGRLHADIAVERHVDLKMSIIIFRK